MKGTMLILAAAAVVLVSNVWALISTWRNRSDATGGTVELTERELGLPPMIGDSTALLLELNWDVYSSAAEDGRLAEWLNLPKLAELGFDCHVPVNSPDARGHYSSLSSAPVYLALEYEGEAWKKARPDRGAKTRLFAVDAARDARRLREKYPDTARYVITWGVVRPFFQDRNRRDGTALPQPRLGGWIEVFPSEIFVPRPYSQELQSLRRRGDRIDEHPEEKPRYAVTVSWGARYEPWVRGVRRLPATAR